MSPILRLSFHSLPLGGLIVLLSAAGLRADTPVWTGAALGSPAWSNTLNWAPHAPSGGDNVLFAASTQMNPQVDTGYSVGSITFAPGSPAYTINVGLGAGIAISGTGVVNNSSSAQTFNNLGSDGVNGPSANIVFYGGATAANVAFVNNPSVLYNTDASFTRFTGNTTAGSAVLVNKGPTVVSAKEGITYFDDAATAASATCTNSGSTINRAKGGAIVFEGITSTAANAAIVNNGGLADGALGGYASFVSSSSAGNATITCNGTSFNYADGGQGYFIQDSTASNATLISNGGLAAGGDGGFFAFNDRATAGNATIIANGSAVDGVDGGYTYFFGNSDGGTARVITNAGASFDISPLSGRGMSIGSIEGAGTFYLGVKTLNTGTNNLSTTVSGTLRDGGYTYAASGSGSLNKIGTGTLTLSGTSIYTGTTTVSGGALVLTGALTNTRSVTVSNGTTLSLGGSGTIGQTGVVTTVTVNAGGTLSGGGTVNGSVTNNGTVAVDGGVLTFTGSVVNNGTLRLTGGARLSASGASSFINNGVLDILGGTASLPPNFSNGTGGVVVDTSMARVLSVSRAGTQVTVVVNGYTTHTYQLQRAETAGGPYTNVEAAQNGNAGGALTFTYQESGAARQGFYRVQVDPSGRSGVSGSDNVGRARLNPVYPGKVRRQQAQ